MNSSAFGPIFTSQGALNLSQEILNSVNYATQGEEEKNLWEELEYWEKVESPKPKDMENYSINNEQKVIQSASKETEIDTPFKIQQSKEINHEEFNKKEK